MKKLTKNGESQDNWFRKANSPSVFFSRKRANANPNPAKMIMILDPQRSNNFPPYGISKLLPTVPSM